MDLFLSLARVGQIGRSRGAGFYYLSPIEDWLGLFAALLVFLWPGMLLVRSDEWKRGEPIEVAGVAFAVSAAFWAVSFWALRFFAVSWRLFAILAMAGAVLVTVLARRKALVSAAAAWRNRRLAVLAQIGFVLAVLALRLAFASTHLAYSGGDMTAHAALAEEIVLTDGFPSTQEPILPIHRFGEVAPGFHAISALATLLSGLPTYRSTILVACLAMAAITFALYALLRALGVSPLGAAAGSSGALLLSRNPQFFLQWGGAPSVLAAAIGFLLLRDLWSLGEEAGVGRALRVGFLAAGVLLTHALPAVALVWIGLAFLLLRCLWPPIPWKTLAANAGLAALTALVLSLPFLIHAGRPPSPEAVQWARGWFRAETRGATLLEQRFFPGRQGGPGAATWPFFLAAYLGALPFFLLLAGLAAAALGPRRKAAAAGSLLLLMQGILFAGGLGEFLPGWPALYPTRTGLWLTIALAVALAELATWAVVAPRPAVAAAAFLWVLAFGFEGWSLSSSRFGIAFYREASSGRASIGSLVANEAAGGAFWVTTYCSDIAAVTAEDLAAFAWVRRHTPASSVFANNPGDGGSLLPAAAHRKILDPHYYWFFDRGEFEAWRSAARVDYVFVGAQPAPAWGRRWKAEDLDRDPRVSLAYRSGRARVYRVGLPFGASFR